MRKLPLLAVLLCAAACAPRDPAASLPPGSWWQGEAAALELLMADLESLEGSLVARQASAVRERLRGCGEFFAHCPPEDPSCSLVAALQCQPATEAAARARRARAEDQWLLATGGGADRRVMVRATALPEGGTRFRLRLPRALGDGASRLLLPGRRQVGNAHLSEAQALFHARIQADGGLNLGALVAAEGWGDRLFSLRNDLFLGTVLTGRWELAVYQPEAGELIPPMVVAIDVRSRERAITAMETFLADVMEKWPVQRSDWRWGEHSGACLGDLRVMPELAPCYLATPRALVVGWNAGSIEQALTGPPAQAPATSSARLFLDRLPAADQRLRHAYDERLRSAPRVAESLPLHYPWRHLEATGMRRGSTYLLDLELSR